MKSAKKRQMYQYYKNAINDAKLRVNEYFLKEVLPKITDAEIYDLICLGLELIPS